MVRRRPALLASLALVGGAAVAPTAMAATPHAAPITISVQTLHFTTHVGPNNGTACDIIGDLYTPSNATPKHRVPAVLTTNGFGGSKDDQRFEARQLALEGYVVLSYSGLGFGGSGCNIQLDDPDWDGKAAKDLVDFLGGASAATNGLRIDYVKRDAVAADGQHYAHDPRVGMIGGSYGGQVQFAAAAVDPRIDTIIPIITWNDLSYSLAPNNTSFVKGVTYSTPGVEKFEWTTFFFGLGAGVGVRNGALATNKSYLDGCLNFDARTCPAKVSMDLTGYPQPSTLEFARHTSVVSYMQKIRIPTLLAQGQGDSLFNLHEAAATYEQLKAQGTPVKLVWQSWGHSRGTPAPGEWDDQDILSTYEGRMFNAWFNYYLKDIGRKPSLAFEYFRPWVSYDGLQAQKAYASAASYPLRHNETLYLSGTDALVTDLATVAPGTASFVAAPAGAPTSFSELSAVGSQVPAQLQKAFDLPGTFAGWTSPPLARDVDVVGVPTVSAKIHASTAVSQLGPGGDLVVFAKLYDVAPDGTQSLPEGIVSPARIHDPGNGWVTISLPGMVHRFAKGHQLRLVLAAGDSAYRGNLVPQVASVSVSSADVGTLVLPTP